MDLQIHRIGAGDIVASRGPVVFRVIRTATTELEDIDEAKAVMSAALERHAYIGALIVVEHGAPIPSAAVRRYAKQAFGVFGDRLIMCHVPLGLGFWAGAAHLAITAITKLTGSPALTAASVEEGARRLSHELIGVDPAKLVSAYEELVSSLDRERADVA